MSEESSVEQARLPGELALSHACRVAIEEDKPVLFDYWGPSVGGTVIIGVRENGEKLLVKNEEEYTSPVRQMFRAQSELVVITENSIYLVADNVQSRKIS